MKALQMRGTLSLQGKQFAYHQSCWSRKKFLLPTFDCI